jgi:hypothetical protein
MVGDSVWDVVAATRVEIPTLGLLTGGVGRCELEEAGAVAVFESLEELQDSLGGPASCPRSRPPRACPELDRRWPRCRERV